MWFYVLAVLIGIALGCFEAVIYNRSKKQFPISIIKLVSISNLFALLILQEVLLNYDGQALFPIYYGSKRVILVYFAAEIVTGLLWIFLTGVFEKHIEIIKEDTSDVPKKKKAKAMVLKIFSVLFAALGMACVTGTIWGKSTWGNLALDEMLVTMLSPTTGTSDEIMSTFWTQPFLQTFAVTFFFALFAFSNRKFVFKGKKKDVAVLTLKLRRIVAFVLSLAMLAGGLTYGVKAFELKRLIKMYATNSQYIEDNFVDPREVKMEFPKEKRNLIYIYLESMENSYLSTDMGGYCDENLLEPLTTLAVNDNGYVFSNTDNFFGGPMSTTGCTWSCASMVNQNAGIPMKVPVNGNQYGQPGDFMSGAVMTGDILAAEGYEQSFMIGSSAVFGGLKYMYEEHGGFNILDYDHAINSGKLPKDYYVYWGYEDDKLYEYAKEELTRLDGTGKPFYMVMETADTHFPDGYVGPNTPRTRSSQYADVIAYSASEVTKFLNWMKEQPFYENTTIILIGDHLSMDKKFFEGWDADYRRTQFNLILNPADSIGEIPQERLRNRYWANFDMFPTTLASIGVKIDGNRLALGTNLFSGEPTLFERNGGEEGWKQANEEFTIGSKFYIDNILNSEYVPFDTKNITEY